MTAVSKREAAWRELKTKITDYGADCAGFQTHDGRGTLEAALGAAEAYATEKALAEDPRPGPSYWQQLEADGDHYEAGGGECATDLSLHARRKSNA